MPREGTPFASSDAFDRLGAAALGAFVARAGDVGLVLDLDGQILDVAFAADDPTGGERKGWAGKRWGEIVTVESRPKIAEMLAGVADGTPPRWRQLNHPTKTGDVPIRWLVAGEANGPLVAIGIDLRATSQLQQRLIQAQQSLERDYLKLRDAEARYKLLFDLDGDAVLIVEADGRRIREANPAAHRLTGAKAGALVNRALVSIVDAASQDTVLAHLGGAAVSDRAQPVTVGLAGKRGPATLVATAFRQGRASYFLVRVTPESATVDVPPAATFGTALARLPDGLVLTDAALGIVSVNETFVELAQEVGAARLTGAPLGDWLGRAGIDLDLFAEQLRQNGSIRNAATILRGRNGAVEEVEVSAVAAPGAHGDGFAFSIRPVGRRARDLPPAQKDLPRSVEQLTELVGRMSLKDIVRESTDLIERLCIEAALEYTSDNRASAAEILGVSRQSLYSKLHRHGLGNLVGDE